MTVVVSSAMMVSIVKKKFNFTIQCYYFMNYYFKVERKMPQTSEQKIQGHLDKICMSRAGFELGVFYKLVKYTVTRLARF